jgi:hypothetical protein
MRVFVDWKLIMLSFILFNSPVATQEQADEYTAGLRDAMQAQETELLSLEDFLQVRTLLWLIVCVGEGLV